MKIFKNNIKNKQSFTIKENSKKKAENRPRFNHLGKAVKGE